MVHERHVRQVACVMGLVVEWFSTGAENAWSWLDVFEVIGDDRLMTVVQTDGITWTGITCVQADGSHLIVQAPGTTTWVPVATIERVVVR